MPAQTLVAGALARLGRAALTFARSIAVRLGLKPEAVRSRALAAGLLTVGTALSVSLLAALGPALAPHTVEAHPMEIAVAAPDLSSEIGAVSRLGTYTPKHYEISSSDTIFSLFAKLGIHDDQARDYIFTQQRLTPFLAPQPGQHVTAGVSNAGQLEYMRIYLDGAREDNSRTIEVSRIGRELISNVLPFTFSTMETLVSGDAVGNLDATARELHIPESVTDQLRAVWVGADDPVEHLTAGSSLRLVYEKSMPTVDSSAMDSSLPHKSSMPPVFTRPFGFPMDEVRAVFIRLTDVPPLKPFYAFRLISKTSAQNLRRFAATPSPAYCAPTTAPTSGRHRDRVFLPPLTDASRALPMKLEATGTTCRSTTALIAPRCTRTCAVLPRAFARASSSRKAMRSVMSA